MIAPNSATLWPGVNTQGRWGIEARCEKCGREIKHFGMGELLATINQAVRAHKCPPTDTNIELETLDIPGM